MIKNLRGLGLAVCGGIECQDPYAGLIRIKKLYPQTPAWLCGQLEVGDVLLHANGNPLTGLSSHVSRCLPFPNYNQDLYIVILLWRSDIPVFIASLLESNHRVELKAWLIQYFISFKVM